MLKKIFSAKLSNRLYVHTKLESLYEYVPREILPSELNGNEKSLAILSGKKFDFNNINFTLASRTLMEVISGRILATDPHVRKCNTVWFMYW